MRDEQHPESHRTIADICENITIAVTVVVLVAGLYAANAFNVRSGDARRVDWKLLGIWLGAAAICLTIGLCLTVICRRRVDNTSESQQDS